MQILSQDGELFDVSPNYETVRNSDRLRSSDDKRANVIKHKFDYELRDGSFIKKVKNIWMTELHDKTKRFCLMEAETTFG